MVRVCQTLQMCVGEWDLAGGCCPCVAQLPSHRPVFISTIFKKPETSRIAFRNCLYCALLKGNQDSRFTLCSPLHSKVKQENWTVKPFVHSAAIHTNKARPTVLGCKSCWFLSSVKTRGQAETVCLAAAVVSAGSTCPAVLSLLEAHTALVIFTLHRQRANRMTRRACLLSKSENDVGSRC